MLLAGDGLPGPLSHTAGGGKRVLDAKLQGTPLLRGPGIRSPLVVLSVSIGPRRFGRRLYPIAGEELRHSDPDRAALSVLMRWRRGPCQTGRFRSRFGLNSLALTFPRPSWLTHALGT